MKNTVSKNALTLDELIKVAERNVQDKTQVFEIAKNSMLMAISELYQHRCTRDALHIKNLNGSPDWDMVFNYNSNETEVATEYRHALLKQYHLIQTGHFDSKTEQHCFAIQFETDTADERLLLKSRVEFILNNLVVNPETHAKSITLENMRDETWNEWEMLVVQKEKKFSIIKYEYGIKREMFTYNCLEDALEKIQSLSDIESETKDTA